MSSNSMKGSCASLLVLVLVLVACAPNAGSSSPGIPLPPGKSFAQNPNLLPGGEFVVVAGTPTAAGPYAFRVRLPAGFKVMPHSHPDDRLYTVLSGTWTIGLGGDVDSTRVQRFGPGQVYVLPAGTVHFHWMVDGGATFQVSGIGPTATTYLRPEDDPRRH